MIHHPSVMTEEVLSHLVTVPQGWYLDCTCGGGGHSEALLQKFPEIGIVATDWDLTAIKRTKERLIPFEERAIVVQAAFADLFFLPKHQKIHSFQGVLADFGTSLFQLKEGEGFSFSKKSFLDMRMSKTHRKKTAYAIINFASIDELCYIFSHYGNEHDALKIAKRISEARKIRRIETTEELTQIIVAEKRRTPSTLHYATKIFQALRIAVNDEYKEIESLLQALPSLLSPGGKFVCISFHSGEDRIVKQFFQNNKKNFIAEGDFILSSDNEIKENNSARSAKMRVFTRIIDR